MTPQVTNHKAEAKHFPRGKNQWSYDRTETFASARAANQQHGGKWVSLSYSLPPPVTKRFQRDATLSCFSTSFKESYRHRHTTSSFLSLPPCFSFLSLTVSWLTNRPSASHAWIFNKHDSQTAKKSEDLQCGSVKGHRFLNTQLKVCLDPTSLTDQKEEIQSP